MKMKNALLWCVLICIVLVAMEVTALLCLTLFEGKWMPASDIRLRQQAVLESGGMTNIPEEVAAFVRKGTRQPGRSIHPYLGFTLTQERPEDRYKLPVSGTGTTLLKRSDDRMIIGIVGGSVARGLGKHVMDENSLRSVLRTHPELTEKEFRFVNLAVAGMKQPQQLMTLSYLLSLGAEFDVLINLDGFNEFFIAKQLTEKEKTFPIYPELWTSRTELRWSEQRMARFLQMQHRRNTRVFFTRISSAPLLRRSALVQFLWSTYDKRLQYTLAKSARNPVGNSIAKDAKWKTDISRGPWSDRYNNEEILFPMMADVWARSSIAMDALARAHGIHYYHFLQPNQYVPDSKPMQQEEQRIALGNDKIAALLPYAYSLLQERIPELGEAHVRLHDLTGVFRSTSERTYHDACCHLNQLGNALVSEAMGHVILADLDSE